ncbi:hypothetical protein D9M69_486720 [compost metagenome]
MNKETLGAISLLVTLVQYIPYCRSIYRKQLRPHVFSYLIWGVSAGIVAVAQWSAEAGPGAWAMALVALLCFLVVGLSYRTGTRYISGGDWIAFIVAMLAIPIWVLTDNPLYAVVVVTLIDIAAFYMTMRKAIISPNEESIGLRTGDAPVRAFHAGHRVVQPDDLAQSAGARPDVFAADRHHGLAPIASRSRNLINTVRRGPTPR